MRIFYAVNFDDKTIGQLKQVQDDLKKHVFSGRWAAPENFHLTIHFVGEIEKGDLPRFKTALDEAAAGIPPFDIRFTSFGSFRQGRQDLIYVKTKYTGDYLQIIAFAIKNNLKCGDTKALKPHITLVRRAEMKHSTLKVIKKQRLNLPPAKITSIELMESIKKDGRLVYVPLHSASLDGAPC